MMSARDRIDMLAALGVQLYLDNGTGELRLRARGPALVLDMARPTLHMHRAALVAALTDTTPKPED